LRSFFFAVDGNKHSWYTNSIKYAQEENMSKKNRCLYIIIAAFFIVAVLLSVPIICRLSAPVVDTTDFSPRINRNLLQEGEFRLQYDGSHLYKTEARMKLMKAREALDDRTVTDTYVHAFADVENEYVTEEYLLYFRSQQKKIADTHALYIQDRASGENRLIAIDVSPLLQIHGQDIFYKTYGEFDSENPNNDTLWCYNIESCESLPVSLNITTFCIQNDILFALSCPTSMHEIGITEHKNILRAYDLATMRPLSEMEIPLDFVATKIMVQNECAVLWSNRQRIYLYDMTKNVGEYLIQHGAALGGQAKLQVNCNDKYLYVTIRVSELTKMDSLSGVESTDAGTWRYDPKTKEWLQISADTYDALYIFDEDYVFGLKGKEIHQIVADGSKFKKITTAATSPWY